MIRRTADALRVVLLASMSMLAAAPGLAHRLAPAYLELREFAPGRAAVLFKTPRIQASGSVLAPTFPADCVRGTSRFEDEAAARLERFSLVCAASLVGQTIGVTGLERSGTDALVQVRLSDGRALRALLTRGDPSLVVPAEERRIDVALDYLALGARHMATGWDHLLFVAGLLLLLRGWRARLTAVSAFTMGHSITLAAAASGLVPPLGNGVEVAIAASLVALAAEASSPTRGPLSRRPALLPLAFGLLHGLGFAAALLDAGLPQRSLPLALLSFNLGIEFAQIVAIALFAAPLAWFLSARRPRALRELPATAIGSLGVFALLERLLGSAF